MFIQQNGGIFLDLTLSLKAAGVFCTKYPVNKRTGDLQWRIVHGAIATNRYVVHLNPSVGVGCPFCTEAESMFHLFVQCLRLGDLFSPLSNWFLSWVRCFLLNCLFMGLGILLRGTGLWFIIFVLLCVLQN